jgi:hypothetical protein
VNFAVHKCVRESTTALCYYTAKYGKTFHQTFHPHHAMPLLFDRVTRQRLESKKFLSVCYFYSRSSSSKQLKQKAEQTAVYKTVEWMAYKFMCSMESCERSTKLSGIISQFENSPLCVCVSLCMRNFRIKYYKIIMWCSWLLPAFCW